MLARIMFSSRESPDWFIRLMAVDAVCFRFRYIPLTGEDRNTVHLAIFFLRVMRCLSRR